MLTLDRLRILAVVLSLLLIGGEFWRSWGVGRPLVFVLDDIIVGVLLIAAAISMMRDTTRRRAFFAASWGISAGMLYGSFFGKVFSPENVVAGNWNQTVLTVLVGAAFVTSCIGTFAAITLPRE